MTTIKILTAAALALIFLSMIPDSRAAIPIETERALQKASPEHLHIEVLKVRKGVRGSQYRVTVKAKVLKVARSAAGVKAGSEITLVYSTPAVPMPSAPPGLVEKGKSYAAYLKQSADGTFDAAAASGTFAPIPAAEKPAE